MTDASERSRALPRYNLSDLERYFVETPAPVSAGNANGAERARSGLPVGVDARRFAEQGAPLLGDAEEPQLKNKTQRQRLIEAVASFYGAGYEVEVIKALAWQGITKSPTGDSARPWTREEVEGIVDDVVSRPAPDPVSLEQLGTVLTSGKPVGTNGHGPAVDGSAASGGPANGGSLPRDSARPEGEPVVETTPTPAGRLAAATGTLGGMARRFRAGVRWLAELYVALGELTMLVGAPESLKSWLVADLARAVHAGHAWLGSIEVPPGGGRVVYFEQERARNLVYQTELLAAGWGQDLDGITTVAPCGIDLCDPAWQQAITGMLERVRPLLVIWNSYRAMFRGHPADSAEVALALGWAGHLAERLDCAIVLVDGTNKAGATGQLRGMAAHGDSIQKEYEADTILHVERGRDPLGRGTGPAKVYVGKQRYGTTSPPPFVVDLVPKSASSPPPGNQGDDDFRAAGVRLLWLDETTVEASTSTAGPTGVERVRRALAAGGEHTAHDLERATGLSLSATRNALTQLKNAGAAVNPARGVWRSSSSSPFPRKKEEEELREPHVEADPDRHEPVAQPGPDHDVDHVALLERVLELAELLGWPALTEPLVVGPGVASWDDWTDHASPLELADADAQLAALAEYEEER